MKIHTLAICVKVMLRKMDKKILLQIELLEDGTFRHVSNELEVIEELALASYLRLIIEQIERHNFFGEEK